MTCYGWACIDNSILSLDSPVQRLRPSNGVTWSIAPLLKTSLTWAFAQIYQMWKFSWETIQTCGSLDTNLQLKNTSCDMWMWISWHVMWSLWQRAKPPKNKLEDFDNTRAGSAQKLSGFSGCHTLNWNCTKKYVPRCNGRIHSACSAASWARWRFNRPALHHQLHEDLLEYVEARPGPPEERALHSWRPGFPMPDRTYGATSALRSSGSPRRPWVCARSYAFYQALRPFRSVAGSGAPHRWGCGWPGYHLPSWSHSCGGWQSGASTRRLPCHIPACEAGRNLRASCPKGSTSILPLLRPGKRTSELTSALGARSDSDHTPWLPGLRKAKSNPPWTRDLLVLERCILA